MSLSVSFFFFKQKTAYERLRSVVGSEMCIRDRCERARISDARDRPAQGVRHGFHAAGSVCDTPFVHVRAVAVLTYNAERSAAAHAVHIHPIHKIGLIADIRNCLLYTSDAADDLLCVVLGVRRIIKKKKHNNHTHLCL